ncbi:hypothetical protein GCK72_007617 [Caenorhabditis remanei]|uniref:BTB domain-containing protein n=1 Tax=Caenorhabditis remanei TaxID=31234 RepID=A0A6A5HIG9_CAERE|nr:hypothetical protein GCK72_007617 [Caenorhabditis remanei]KAF1767658.1 hypothetical protein GCK72_007617 [Caenorhabditis remanei]
MSGIYKENLRSFNETMEEFSDAVLIVNDEKFYVSKLRSSFPDAHLNAKKIHFSFSGSNVFIFGLSQWKTIQKAFFSRTGKFNEAKKTEIKLSGIDADDFQNYLEVLYGEQAIDEITVEGILMVADIYDTSLVTQKCENFLQKESKKELKKKKLQLSTRYNLPKLMKQCLGEIKSMDDIESVIPGDIHDLDPSIMAEFLQRALYLYNSE